MSLRAFDYETTSLNPRKGRVFGYVITDENCVSEVFDLDAKGTKGKIARSHLKEFFADPEQEKIAHNLKFELHFTRTENLWIHPETIFHDTMLMSQICNNLEVSHSLEDLAAAYCPDRKLVKFWREIDARVRAQATLRGKRYDRVDRPLMHTYQENDGFRTMLLNHLFLPQLKENSDLWEEYRNEVDVVYETQLMEGFGLRVSHQNMNDLEDFLQEESFQALHRLFPIVKGFPNWRSDDELRALLFDQLKLSSDKKTDKGDALSVDKDVLFDLKTRYPEHTEMINDLLKYRSYTQGISTLTGYRERVENGDIIYHTINTNKARTGRQSATNPNLQNVAKEAALKNPYPVPARKCFIPREDSWMAYVDYSGIEMRLIIDAVNDETMIQTLWDGGDVHALASEYWFGKMFTDLDVCLNKYLPTNEGLFKEFKKQAQDLDPSSPEFQELRVKTYQKCRKVLRGAGKNSQFALAYGGSLDAIADACQMPVEMMKTGYDAYSKKFPKIASFTSDSMRMASKDGFVTTSFGRILNVDRTKVHAAANYRIQGTAASMLKRAEVRVARWLRENYPDIKPLLPIHDEMVFHFPKKYKEERDSILKKIGELMTDFPRIKVPLEVEWEFTDTNWNEKKPYEIGDAA